MSEQRAGSVPHFPVRIGGRDVDARRSRVTAGIGRRGTEVKGIHLDPSRRLDRRVYDELLSEPPLGD